jgi:FkbM family methyltransferase
LRAISAIKGNLFVDVGANLGFYVDRLKRNFDQVIAVEADPFIFQLLKRRLPHNARAINACVTDKNGTVDFYALRNYGRKGVILGSALDPHLRLGWRNHAVGGLGPDSFRKIRVPAITLNKLLKATAVELVLVDVEGAEWSVLKGSTRIMSRIRRWCIELHDIQQRSKLEAYMQSFGYRIKWLDGNHLYASEPFDAA